MKGQLRIDEVHVFIVLDADGTEGIPAIAGPLGVMMPMIAADRARLDALMPMAQRISRELRKTVRLCRFSTRELVETIGAEWESSVPGNEVRS